MKKLLAAVLCFCIMLTLFSACQVVRFNTDYLAIVSNAVKYKKEDRLPYTGAEKLEAQVARNEYEGMQFLLNFKRDVKDIKVYVTELTDAKGNKITKDNISLYRQHYMYTTSDSPAYAERKGWYPDAIIPVNIYEDLNTVDVKAGENQGFWLSVKAEENQPAGIYTGEVTIKFEGKERKIPVEVEVWDITIPKESSLDTIYFGYAEYMLSYLHRTAQRNTGKDLVIDKDEYYRNFREFFLDYRITCQDTTQYFIKKDPYKDPVGWADEITQYFKDNPRVTCHTFGSYGVYIYRDTLASAQKAPQWLLDATDRLRENGVLDRFYSYITDEPRYTPGVIPELQIALETLQRDIPDLQNLITNPPCTSLDGYVNTWCPIWGDMTENQMKDHHERGEHVFQYACFMPQYPSCTYHIPDELMSSRLIRWMFKDWGVEGDLNWAAMCPAKIRPQNQGGESDRDIWNEPNCWNLASPGDGYIAYHGCEGDGMINHNIPIPSLRLESARDGFEDYELLLILENKYKKLIEKFGIDANIDDIMDTYFFPLWESPEVFDHDPARMLEMRKRVAHDILNAEEIVSVLCDIRKDAPNSRKLVVYAEKGSEVSVDGELLAAKDCGKCSVFEKSYNMDEIEDFKEIEVVVNGRKYIRTLRPILNEIKFFEQNRNKIENDMKVLGVPLTVEEVSTLYKYNTEATVRAVPEGQYQPTYEEALKLSNENMIQDITNKIPLVITNKPTLDVSQEENLSIYVPKGAKIKVNGKDAAFVETKNNYDLYEYTLDCTGYAKAMYEVSVSYKGITEVSRKAVETTVIKNVFDFNDIDRIKFLETLNNGKTRAKITINEDGSMTMSCDLREENGQTKKVIIPAKAFITEIKDFPNYGEIYIKVTNMGDKSTAGLRCGVGSNRDESWSEPSNRLPAGESVDLYWSLRDVKPSIQRNMNKVMFEATDDSGIVTFRIEAIKFINRAWTGRYV